MRDMLSAGVHFGHRTRFRNPKMRPYIFGDKHDIHIINLEKTLPLYLDAVNFVSKLAASNSKILFVGTKQSASNVIKEEAIRCGMPYVDYRWLGGMLTNYKTVRKSIKRLKDLEVMRDSKKFAAVTKKEALNLMRELSKLERSLGGIKNMGGLPDALFVVDTGIEHIAIKEAKKLKIPVIGVVDTNHDPDDADYLIPGNDDAERAIRFYTRNMAEAIIIARAAVAPKEQVEKKVEVVKKEVKAKKTVVKEADTEEKVEEQAASHEEKKVKTVRRVVKKAEVEKETEAPVAKEKEAPKKTAAKKTTTAKKTATTKKVADDSDKKVAKKATAKKVTKKATKEED